MGARYLAAGTAVWATAYLLLYAALVDQQGDSPIAWWYVTIVGCGVVFMVGAALGRTSMFFLILAVAALGVAMILAVASIGLLLLPAVGGAATVIGLGGAEKSR